MATTAQTILDQQLGMFDVGDMPTFTATFCDTAGALASPTAVTFILRNPAGIETPYVAGTASEVENPATGVFTFTVPVLTTAGTYRLRAKGTATVIAAVEGSFTVRPSRFTSP